MATRESYAYASNRLKRLALAVVTVGVVLMIGSAAWAALPAGGTFLDDDANTHQGNIEAIAAEDITKGCILNTFYCPGEDVTRGQMASFLARAFDLPASPTDFFGDDDGTTHEDNINRIANAGITLGFPDGTYQPQGLVSREQMGSFIARAMGLAPIPGNVFLDVSGTHEGNINAIADAEVTLGCNPEGTLYCPFENVRRDQMASFLARATGLMPIAVAPRPTTPTGGQLNLLTDPFPPCDTSTPPVVCVATHDFPADAAFYIKHGWATDDNLDLTSLQSADIFFELFIDGIQVFGTETLDLVSDPKTKTFVAVFPGGLSGSHTIVGKWWKSGSLDAKQTVEVDFS